jgi:hypothetical protein
MEGAIAASAPASDRPAAVMAALVVGFDFVVREDFVRIVGDPPAGAECDRVAELLNASTAPASLILSRVLASAWRSALVAVAEGADPHEARAALLSLGFRVSLTAGCTTYSRRRP